MYMTRSSKDTEAGFSESCPRHFFPPGKALTSSFSLLPPQPPAASFIRLPLPVTALRASASACACAQGPPAFVSAVQLMAPPEDTSAAHRSLDPAFEIGSWTGRFVSNFIGCSGDCRAERLFFVLGAVMREHMKTDIREAWTDLDPCGCDIRFVTSSLKSGPTRSASCWLGR